MSASLGLAVVADKARICGLAALLIGERAAVRNTKGAILVAMAGGVWRATAREWESAGWRRAAVDVVKECACCRCCRNILASGMATAWL